MLELILLAPGIGKIQDYPPNIAGSLWRSQDIQLVRCRIQSQVFSLFLVFLLVIRYLLIYPYRIYHATGPCVF